MTCEIWPGIGLSTEPFEWVKVLGSAEGKAKSSANVERRRKESGGDFSTFKGMSRKADALIERAKAAPRRVKTPGGPKGPALRDESWSGKIRAELRNGSRTRPDLCAVLGIKPTNISGYLKSDIKQGRILVVAEEGCLRRFVLAEGA